MKRLAHNVALMAIILACLADITGLIDLPLYAAFLIFLAAVGLSVRTYRNARRN